MLAQIRRDGRANFAGTDRIPFGASLNNVSSSIRRQTTRNNEIILRLISYSNNANEDIDVYVAEPGWNLAWRSWTRRRVTLTGSSTARSTRRTRSLRSPPGERRTLRDYQARKYVEIFAWGVSSPSIIVLWSDLNRLAKIFKRVCKLFMDENPWIYFKKLSLRWIYFIRSVKFHSSITLTTLSLKNFSIMNSVQLFSWVIIKDW